MKLNDSKSLSFLLIFVIGIAGWLRAEAEVAGTEFRFPNGDSIRGMLVSETETELVIATENFGEITVRRDGVTRVEIAPLTDASLAKAVVEELAPEDPSPAPKPEPKTESKQTPVKNPDAVAKATTPKKKNPWTGEFEFGFRQQEGRRDAVDFDLRASADRKIDQNSFNAKARLLYGEQDGKLKNDRYDGSFRWRRELSERTFAQSLTSYYSDNLKAISSNWEQNVGAGLRLFKNDAHVMNVGAGLTGQYRESDAVDEEFFALIELFQDYSYQINERLKFSQNAAAQYSPDARARFISVGNQPSTTTESVANYKVRLNTALQGKVTKHISLNLRFEYEFDNAVAPKDARADQRVSSSISYGF